jgi:hypothetical protein
VKQYDDDQLLRALRATHRLRHTKGRWRVRLTFLAILALAAFLLYLGSR